MTTSLSKLWGTKREIYTALATLITSHLIACRRSKHQVKLWCILPWEVDLRSIRSPNLKLAHCKHKKALAQSLILLLKSIWSRWTKYKRREPNLQLKRDLRTWCRTLRIITWISMQWLIVLLLIPWSIRTTNKISEAHKANHLLKESMECK